MAELVMLVDMQRMVYPEAITHQLHVMAQAMESSPVIDHCATTSTVVLVSIGSFRF